MAHLLDCTQFLYSLCWANLMPTFLQIYCFFNIKHSHPNQYELDLVGLKLTLWDGCIKKRRGWRLNIDTLSCNWLLVVTCIYVGYSIFHCDHIYGESVECQLWYEWWGNITIETNKFIMENKAVDFLVKWICQSRFLVRSSIKSSISMV